MVSKKCVINYPIFAFFIVVFSVNFGTNFALSTLFVEELCYGTGYGTIKLGIQKSAILASVPSEEQNCQIRVQTRRSSSIVVAFYRYHLYENDSLTFTDRHNFKLALDGEGYYVDERKSVILEAPVNINYYTQHVRPDTKLKFQVILTEVNDAPCNYDEYQCQNNKCIAKELACDQHNHCGDLTHQDKCTPKGDIVSSEVTVKVTNRSPFIIAVIVSSVVLFIVVIAFIVGVVRTRAGKKGNAQPSSLPTVAASVEPPQPPQPSVLSRIRQSFRGMRQPTAPPHPDSAGQHSESCEVPSMYPKLPSDISGVDNPDFKSDE